MAQRRFHYERAFEHYLRAARIPYVAVDEARKALVHDDLAPEIAAPMAAAARSASLKSFDFVVYGPRANLLVELKGRKIRLRANAGPGASAAAAAPRVRCAATGAAGHGSTATSIAAATRAGEAPGDDPSGAIPIAGSLARRAHAEAARRAGRGARRSQAGASHDSAAGGVPSAASARRPSPSPFDDPHQQAFPFFALPSENHGGDLAEARGDRPDRSRSEDRRAVSRLPSLNPAFAPPPELRPPKTGRLESWTTRGDVQSLLAWERLFGEDFRAVFVFVYWCEAQPPDTLFQDVFPFEERWYSMRLIAVDRYDRAMVARSRRWNTVHVPPALYERLSEPFTRAYGLGLGLADEHHAAATAHATDGSGRRRRVGDARGRRAAGPTCQLPLWLQGEAGDVNLEPPRQLPLGLTRAPG